MMTTGLESTRSEKNVIGSFASCAIRLARGEVTDGNRTLLERISPGTDVASLAPQKWATIGGSPVDRLSQFQWQLSHTIDLGEDEVSTPERAWPH